MTTRTPLLYRSSMAQLVATALFALIVTSSALAASSESIRTAIFSSIEASGTFHGYEIEIEARNGSVWLRGHVKTEDDKIKINRIAAGTKGVKEVHNELTIKVETEKLTTEESARLARSVQERIKAIASQTGHAVTITCENTTISLLGAVHSEIYKGRILNAARTTPGVLNVIDNLTVSRPDDAAIAERVREAIQSDGQIQIENLSISSNAGVVTLGGKGKSHHDTDRALALTLNIDGVEEIVSNFSGANRQQADPTK